MSRNVNSNGTPSQPARNKAGKASKTAGLPQGRYNASDKGFGFFIPDDGSQDLFVPPGQSGGAWHGDRVAVTPMGDTDGRGPTARVEAVLSRETAELTGRLFKTNQGVWVRPDDRRLPEQLEVAQRSDAKDGDKVALRVTSHGEERKGRNPKPPTGEIIEVLGKDGTFEAAIEAILHNQGVRRRFSQRTLAQARSVPVTVPQDAIRGREDLRDTLIFTIDGADAKDLDDAVSLTYDASGRRILGVHIADVSHYVTADSATDADAWARGTSVYFADKVIPMLPPELSNGICSLHGGVDRLCLSALMTVDQTGETVDTELKQTVIRSAARMTYGDCNAILAGDAALSERYAFLKDTLLAMDTLAKQMNALRRARGALDIEAVESHIICDEDGRPVDVMARSRGDSERLIEAFMLAANEAVAGQLFWPEHACVYRVHQSPNPSKLEDFYKLALSKGLRVRKPKAVTGGPLQDILDQAGKLPAGRVIHNALLRSMMKARYSVENIGHFGLASKCYCHFTSPIRRYPDLMVHRCLKDFMGWTAPRDDWNSRCAEAADQSTGRELAADAAERNIEKLYKALYMVPFIGNTFTGIISGIQTYGFYVELPSTVEGLVSVHTLHGDLYVMDDSGLRLVGETTGVTYEAGDQVKVVCVASDPLSGRIDFELC